MILKFYEYTPKSSYTPQPAQARPGNSITLQGFRGLQSTPCSVVGAEAAVSAPDISSRNCSPPTLIKVRGSPCNRKAIREQPERFVFCSVNTDVFDREHDPDQLRSGGAARAL